MMNEQTPQRYVVEIFGERHVLRGTQPEAEIRRLAALVDERMRDVALKAPIMSAHQVAILVTLQCLEEKETTQTEFDELREAWEALASKHSNVMKEQKQMFNELEVIRQELIELQQANAKLHSLKETLQRENNNLREDKFIWGQEKDLLTDENMLLNKERARLKTDLDELTSLLESATSD
ncbi:MAG: cell division protein ZapA [Peptococcaceae bacterium]|nr:cell division protein ZapA [Peptococcaceae bacterium]